MRLLLGVTSAAVYAGTRIVAGAVGGAVLGVLLHRRTQRQLPARTDFLARS